MCVCAVCVCVCVCVCIGVKCMGYSHTNIPEFKCTWLPAARRQDVVGKFNRFSAFRPL